MTWDATYLYFASNNYLATHNNIVYLDVDPLSTPGGGTASNGNLAGITDSSVTPSLPFRADVRTIRKFDGTCSLSTRDGPGSWSAEDTGASDISCAVAGLTVEIRVRWMAMPGLSSIPSSFLWLGYEIDS